MLYLISIWLSLPRLDRKGVTSLEYAVLAFGLVALVYAGSTALGGDIKAAFTSIGTWLTGLSMASS